MLNIAQLTFMRVLGVLFSVLLGGLFSGPSLAAVSNTYASFSEIWSIDLADALPKDLEKAAFAKTGNVGSVPCANGVAYFSEGGNINGGWSMASFVCHRHRDKNQALWVVSIPQYPGPFTDERRLVGIDCTFAGNGWRCKKRVKMRSPFEPSLKSDARRRDDEAFNYIKIL